MADWQRTLKLQPEWGKCQEDEITIQELAVVVADRLEKLAPFTGDIEEERLEIVEEFRDFATDETGDKDDFDEIMARLYDWGDTPLEMRFNGKKVCFVDWVSQ